MKYYLFLLLILASCSPAKRIERQQKQFDDVGRRWLALHPCVNDSATIYIPGDTIVSEHTDTIYNDLPDVYISNDTVYMPGQVKIITHTVTRNVHDTVKVIVKDILEDRLCQSDLRKSEDQLAESKLKEAKGKKWIWISISLIILCMGLIYNQIRQLV